MSRKQGDLSAPRKEAHERLDSLRQSLPWLIQDFCADATPPMTWRTDGSVYQYTRYETLRSMMGGNVLDSSKAETRFPHLWATSSSHLNDKEEFERGREVIADAVSALPKDEVSRRMRLALRDADGLEVYCACFTARPDDLSQWRGYGDNGAGVVIEFDLAEMLRSIRGVGYWVVYGKKGDDATQKSVSTGLVRYLHNAIHDLVPTPTPEAVWTEVREQLVSIWPALLLAFKHRDFEAEEEFRVVYSEAVAEALPVWFRPHPLIPFVKLPMRSGPLPVRSISLGPAIASDTNIRSLRLAIETLGLEKIRVGKSDIPYVPK